MVIVEKKLSMTFLSKKVKKSYLEIIRSCLAETVKIVAPHGLNASNISYSINKQAVRQKAPRF